MPNYAVKSSWRFFQVQDIVVASQPLVPSNIYRLAIGFNCNGAANIGVSPDSNLTFNDRVFSIDGVNGLFLYYKDWGSIVQSAWNILGMGSGGFVNVYESFWVP